MHVELTRWDDGKVGLSLGIGKVELKTLIARLQEIVGDPEQHFHISHVPGSACDVGDIEVYSKEVVTSNMTVSSHALGVGQTVGEE